MNIATALLFLRTLAILAAKQSSAIMAAGFAAMAFAIVYIPNTAIHWIEVKGCNSPLTDLSVRRAAAEAGADPAWLLSVEQTAQGSKIHFAFSSESERPLYPDDLSRQLGCEWDHSVHIDHSQFDDVFIVITLTCLPVALLTLSLLHRSTRSLVRGTQWRSAWRIPAPLLAAVVGLMTVQIGVGVLFPDFLAHIAERQLTLLNAPGILALLVLAPIAEELWFRATALRIFEQYGFALSGWLVTSISFAVLHGLISNNWQVMLYYWLVLTVLGMALGRVWMQTRNWASCVLLHYLNNLPAMAMAFIGAANMTADS